MKELKALVDEYIHANGSSYRSVSGRMGMSHGTLAGWFGRGRTGPPEPADLLLLSREIKVSYRNVLDAMLIDFGYLPEDAVSAERKAGTGDGTPATQRIRRTLVTTDHSKSPIETVQEEPRR